MQTLSLSPTRSKDTEKAKQHPEDSSIIAKLVAFLTSSCGATDKLNNPSSTENPPLPRVSAKRKAKIKNIKHKPIEVKTQHWIIKSQECKRLDCHICDKPLVETLIAIDGFDPNSGKHKGAAQKKCYFQSPTIIGPKAKRKPKGDDTDTCYICDKSLVMKNYRDCVRDHCHITDDIDAQHTMLAISMQLRLSTTVPVFFHNLRGYNSHL